MTQQIENSSCFSNIEPNVIYNRFDLFCDNYIVLQVSNLNHLFFIEVKLDKKMAELGSCLMSISNEEMDEIKKYLFSHYPGIDYISAKNIITDIKNGVKDNYYHLSLAQTYEELEGHVSSKGRYNMRRMLKKAGEEVGEVRFEEYLSSTIPEGIVNKYFELKRNTHKTEYHLTVREYLEKYHVTNGYVLYFGDNIASILFTCEQCPIVYLENLTYDTAYSVYSPSMLAYDSLLKVLIQKGKKELFLGGGDYIYKKKYESSESQVESVLIYRTRILGFKYRIRHISMKSIKNRITRCAKALIPIAVK